MVTTIITDTISITPIALYVLAMAVDNLTGSGCCQGNLQDEFQSMLHVEAEVSLILFYSQF